MAGREISRTTRTKIPYLPTIWFKPIGLLLGSWSHEDGQEEKIREGQNKRSVDNTKTRQTREGNEMIGKRRESQKVQKKKTR